MFAFFFVVLVQLIDRTATLFFEQADNQANAATSLDVRAFLKTKNVDMDVGTEAHNKRTHFPCFFLMLCCMAQLLLEDEEAFEFDNSFLVRLFDVVWETRVEPSIDSRFSKTSFIHFWTEYSTKNIENLGMLFLLL